MIFVGGMPLVLTVWQSPQAGSSGPTCPALACSTRGFGHTTSCHGAPAGGGTAITPTDQSQPGMFMRRKHFQIISGEKKIKKTCENCFWLHTISQLAVKKGLLRSLANILFNH